MDNKEDLKVASKTLLEKIQKKIDELSGEVNAYGKSGNEAVIGNVNRLKTQEFKLKTAIERLEGMDTADFQEEGSSFQKNLTAAEEALLSI